MEIFLIILISVLIGVFVIDVILGFVNGIIDVKHLEAIEQRLRSIETLFDDSENNRCNAIGFDIGGDSEDE